MTFYTLLLYAVMNNPRSLTDSERMEAQFKNPTLDLATSGQRRAPIDPYENYTRLRTDELRQKHNDRPPRNGEHQHE